MTFRVPLSTLLASDGNVTYAQGSVLRVGVGGNINAAGTSIIDTNGNVTIAGNVLPLNTNTVDLGSAAQRWRNIYTQDLHLSNGIGDWTVVEGEENLYIVNNKSGKSFKFALIEVNPSEVPPKSTG